MTKSTNKENSEKVDNNEKLTDGQRAFIEHYIITENATESYFRAYPKSNKGTAGVNAHRLLKMEKITNEIARRKAELKKARHVASAEEILMRLTTMAFDPEVRPSEQLKALELLGKNQALWVDRVEHTNQTEFVIELGGNKSEQIDYVDMPTEYIEHDED